MSGAAGSGAAGAGGTPAASEIPSTGPSTVQADLDALKDIESAADLEDRFPAVGGEHTIDQGSVWRLPQGADTIDISPNVIVGVFPGGITFVGAQGKIQTNADAPLVSGEMNRLDNVILSNVGAGANAECISTTSPFGRNVRWTSVVLLGQRPGRLVDAVGIVRLSNLDIIPFAPGASSFVLDGTIGALIGAPIAVICPGGVKYTGINIPATASIGATKIDPAVFGQVAGDAFIRVDTGATIGGVIGLLLGVSDLPAVMMDPTGIDEKDPRMYLFLNQNAPASQWFGEVTLDTNGLDPITLNHTGGVEVMPTENTGATAVATMNPDSQRFTFELDGLQDAQLVAGGRTDATTGPVSWFATVKRSGGAVRQFTGWIQSRPGPDPAVWTTITRSKGAIPLDTIDGTVRGEATVRWDVETEFRLVVQGDLGTATEIKDYDYRVGPGHP